jgi:hypothetical protein
MDVVLVEKQNQYYTMGLLLPFAALQKSAMPKGTGTN